MTNNDIDSPGSAQFGADDPRDTPPATVRTTAYENGGIVEAEAADGRRKLVVHVGGNAWGAGDDDLGTLNGPAVSSQLCGESASVTGFAVSDPTAADIGTLVDLTERISRVQGSREDARSNPPVVVDNTEAFGEAVDGAIEQELIEGDDIVESGTNSTTNYAIGAKQDPFGKTRSGGNPVSQDPVGRRVDGRLTGLRTTQDGVKIRAGSAQFDVVDRSTVVRGGRDEARETDGTTQADVGVGN